MSETHTFHIPVMGIGYTIDTPLKVAQYGIDSVISLVDDILVEKLRKMYSDTFKLPYQEITEKMVDYRAKRITHYLNLIHDLVEKKFEALKQATSDNIEVIQAYVHMLPDNSSVKTDFKKIISSGNFNDLKTWVNKNLKLGSIDVNIMTKVDKDNYLNNEKLPVEYNDAHAALRGFANSKLNSAVVLSAGLNPRLYSYMAQFEDFFPNEKGVFQKKIILKVSDYRSALIQGKFLAKKGLWVSEFRIESGLNCGGHAFATDGYLLGPVLAEFKEKRDGLSATLQELVRQEFLNQNRFFPDNLSIRVSAQGGVGTHEEHEFLRKEYQLDSVGWGTPFLLVPEATTVDDTTLSKLINAKEHDLYLSNISPLGVPFNNLRNNTKDKERDVLINKGRPGSSCPKKFVELNKEFKDKGLCIASREYQYLKIKELDSQNVAPEVYQTAFNQIIEKSCVCVGLGTSAMLAYNLDTTSLGEGVSICPGPNMAYYSKIMSLKNITDHIYGRDNMITRKDRPNIFIKELYIYIDYLKDKFETSKFSMNKKDEKYLLTFIENLHEGILYYKRLFSEATKAFQDIKNVVLNELEKGQMILNGIKLEIQGAAVLN